MNSKRAELLMASVAFAWGSSYLLMKVGLDSLSPFNLISLRFGIAFIGMTLLFHRQFKKLTVTILKKGLLMGGLLFLMFTGMVCGVNQTTASAAGFLTSTTVILVPVLECIIKRKLPDKIIIISVLLVMAGLYCLTVQEINTAPVRADQTIRIDKLLKAKEQELIKITGITDGLYMDRKSGDITRSEYHRMKATFEEQAEHLKEVIDNLHEERKDFDKGVTANDPYLTTFLKYKNIQKLERSILVDLVEMIYVHADKGIEIKFKFADQHKRVMSYIESNLAAQKQAQIKAV